MGIINEGVLPKCGAVITKTTVLYYVLNVDCVEASGQPLLKALVTCFASQQCPVHVFLLEGGKRDWETLGTQYDNNRRTSIPN